LRTGQLTHIAQFDDVSIKWRHPPVICPDDRQTSG